MIDGGTTMIDHQLLQKAESFAKALNDKMRQKILKLIDDQGKIDTTQLKRKLKINDSTISYHLKVLSKAKIIKSQRLATLIGNSASYKRGSKFYTSDKEYGQVDVAATHSQRKYYSINEKRLSKVINLLCKLGE
jgi:DNA-binding transcriptional ArsR family regulator